MDIGINGKRGLKGLMFGKRNETSPTGMKAAQIEDFR